MATESDDIDNIVNNTKSPSNNSNNNINGKIDSISISGSGGGGSIPRTRGQMKQIGGLAVSNSIEDITNDGNKLLRNIGESYKFYYKQLQLLY